jgi:hypothetical protein
VSHSDNQNAHSYLEYRKIRRAPRILTGPRETLKRKAAHNASLA